MFKELEEIRKGFVITAGNFNIALDKEKDKWDLLKLEKNNSVTVLNRMIKKTDLKDIERTMKGDEKAYTFFSVHKRYSRIDHIFVSNSLV